MDNDLMISTKHFAGRIGTYRGVLQRPSYFYYSEQKNKILHSGASRDLPYAVLDDVGDDCVDCPGEERGGEGVPVVAEHDEGRVGRVVRHPEGVAHLRDRVLGRAINPQLGTEPAGGGGGGMLLL